MRLMGTILWMVILWKIASYTPIEGVSMNAQQPPHSGLEMPVIILETEKRYLLGFPIVIAVTFENTTEDVHFLDLPELGLLLTYAPIAIQMDPIGDGVSFGTQPSSEEMGVPSMTLDPGEKKRMALDLSNFGMNIQPGTYSLNLTISINEYSRRSNSVEVEFVMPSLEDMLEATRLRRLGVSPTDTGAWAPFLKRNWNTVEVSSELSPDAGRQLAMHLFLHRAFYGPDGVGQVELSALKAVDVPVISTEILVLEFEVFNASNDVIARDRLGQEILSKWPELHHRLQQILQGGGLLTTGRRWFGAEKEFIKPPNWYPYRD